MSKNLRTKSIKTGQSKKEDFQRIIEDKSRVVQGGFKNFRKKYNNNWLPGLISFLTDILHFVT